MALLNNVTIGTYIPGNSLVHRINPLAKIISMIIILIGIFIITDIRVYLVVLVLVAILVKMANMSFLKLLKRMRILLFMSIFLFFVNAFVITTGPVLFSLGFFTLHLDALLQTVMILLRLMLMIFISSLLTMTTKPLDLTLGLEQMFSPLKRFGFPAHELAMMISIALRFIPVLVEETNKIMIAQTSRGVDFNSPKFKEKITAIISLLIPLFTSAIKRAEDLADAMEARGYSPDGQRTRFNQYVWKKLDTFVIVFSILFTGSVIWYTLTR